MKAPFPDCGAFTVEELVVDGRLLTEVRFDYEWDETNQEFFPTYIEYVSPEGVHVAHPLSLNPTSAFEKALMKTWNDGQWSEFLFPNHEWI